MDTEPQNNPVERESSGGALEERDVWRRLDELNLERESSGDDVVRSPSRSTYD